MAFLWISLGKKSRLGDLERRWSCGFARHYFSANLNFSISSLSHSRYPFSSWHKYGADTPISSATLFIMYPRFSRILRISRPNSRESRTSPVPLHLGHFFFNGAQVIDTLRFMQTFSCVLFFFR